MSDLSHNAYGRRREVEGFRRPHQTDARCAVCSTSRKKTVMNAVRTGQGTVHVCRKCPDLNV